jgi:hypothetical protein
MTTGNPDMHYTNLARSLHMLLWEAEANERVEKK